MNKLNRTFMPGSSFALIIFFCCLLFPMVTFAQAPAVLWRTNIAARVFAVDEQTNIYAQAGGTVIKVSADGVPLQTNNLSLYTGRAARDPSGNFYYSGNYPPKVVFEGWQYTNFLAKYTSSGEPVWTVEFGAVGTVVADAVTDLQVEPVSGAVYLGWDWMLNGGHYGAAQAARYESTSSNSWDMPMPYQSQFNHAPNRIRLGGLTSSNGYVVTFVYSNPSGPGAMLSRFDSAGNAAVLASWNTVTDAAMESQPVVNSSGEIYNVEGNALTKRISSGSVVWSNSIGYSGWTMAGDIYGGVHVAGTAPQLARYDFDGKLAWSLNSFAATPNAVIVDNAGNRFISLGNGEVARLAAESVSAPLITNAPQGQTVMVGSNVLFSIGASGAGPVRYFWLFNNSFLPGKTNASLPLNNVTLGQAGLYSVVVSNFLGSVTSAPALLRVKQVALFWGNQLLTNGTYAFTNSPTLSIRSTFNSGSSFYTLDGSAPSFSSTYYSGPFTVNLSGTVRAIGYSADFSQSEEADSINVVLLVSHTLSASASGGGSVSLNPPGGTYVATNVVTATAAASNGWTFLYWLGDVSGTNPVVNISMERDKAIYGVFGTTLATTVSGAGQVQVYPSANLYPYGSVVRLTGIPDPGNYFGFWGNAATGNTNPLYFTITSPTSTVSSIFGALPPGQAALTVLTTGEGRVNVDPRANAYALNQSVTLTAVPDAGRKFLNWSGDATGTQNPLSINMDQSKVITANFSVNATLRVTQPGVEGFTSAGFRFTLLSEPNLIWRIEGSTNLATWQLLGTITNQTGASQFTDGAALGLSRRFYRAVEQ